MIGIGIGVNRQRFRGGGGGGFDADYQAVLDYATLQGYTLPSSGQQVKQNQLMLDLKTAGVWSKLDTFAVFATDGNSDFALIDWVRLLDYTAVNSPTFTTDSGFKGNGTSSYIDSNFSPSNAVKANVNSISFGYYCKTIDSAPGTSEGVWSTPSINSPIHWIRYSTKRLYVNSGSATYTNFNAASDQFVVANRTSSSAINLYADGVLQDSLSIATNGTLDTNKMEALKWTNSFSDAELGMVYYGANLTAEMSGFNTAWRNYLNAL